MMNPAVNAMLDFLDMVNQTVDLPTGTEAFCFRCRERVELPGPMVVRNQGFYVCDECQGEIDRREGRRPFDR